MSHISKKQGSWVLTASATLWRSSAADIDEVVVGGAHAKPGKFWHYSSPFIAFPGGDSTKLHETVCRPRFER